MFAQELAPDAIAPPFDSVGAAMREALYERSPHNIVRLTLPKDRGPEGYRASRKMLDEWLAEGVLVGDREEALYAEEQEFGHEGEKRRLISFIGLLRLDRDADRIFPHERIFEAPMRDRLDLLRATRANLEPIHLLFRDAEARVRTALERQRPEDPLSIQDDWGVVHRVWPVRNREAIEAVARTVSASHLIIADGHHRHAASVEFMKENPGDGNARYRMATFSPLDDEGLVILPTHRLVSGAAGFDVRTLNAFECEGTKGFDDLRARMRSRDGAVFGALDRQGGYVLRLRDPSLVEGLPLHPSLRKLDVTILHEFVLSRACLHGRIDYVPALEQRIKRALEELELNEGSLLFLLNPTLKAQVEEVALAGERMPQKSTFFWPKVWSGLVLWKP